MTDKTELHKYPKDPDVLKALDYLEQLETLEKPFNDKGLSAGKRSLEDRIRGKEWRKNDIQNKIT